MGPGLFIFEEAAMICGFWLCSPCSPLGGDRASGDRMLSQVDGAHVPQSMFAVALWLPRVHPLSARLLGTHARSSSTAHSGRVKGPQKEERNGLLLIN
jgi:hypothetical protein